MTIAAWRGDERRREADFAGARWLVSAQLWRPRGEDSLATGHVETAVVLLSGTFDLSAGGTAWPARGARTTPFAGRPMAVFLPPDTVLHARADGDGGTGEMLLVSARQPARPPEPTGREALGRKPLLPLAGSGKAFDPNSGEWRPAETFVTSAESLPPRRVERIDVGGLVLERVFPPDYKALTLSVDEVVVPAGRTLRLADVPRRPACDEVLVFVRPVEGARIEHAGAVHEVDQDFVGWLTAPAGETVRIAAGGGAAYVVLAYAGKGS